MYSESSRAGLLLLLRRSCCCKNIGVIGLFVGGCWCWDLYKINRLFANISFKAEQQQVKEKKKGEQKQLCCVGKEKKMLFHSFFKTLVGKEVTVELKNDLAVKGILHSVDQWLNIKLENVQVVDKVRFPQLQTVDSLFIRGSVVRFVMMDPKDVDTDLLQEATRRESQAK
jgi:U6 snRNA-associated Sm-like protein LSm2